MAAVTGSGGERRFVTMRFKRIKTWGHVYHVRRHNTREMECRHLEKDAPPPRLIIGTADVGGEIRQLLDRYGVKHRPGEVLALEFVVSTSREVFEGLDQPTHDHRLQQFIVRTCLAFSDRFKIPGQVVSVAPHEDERTPHLHIVVVPLIHEPDNRRKDKTPIYRLSAKRVVGGRGDMSREQTRFASFFEEMGLERGKERSGARNVSNREHEAMLEKARLATLTERDQLARDRQGIADLAVEMGDERDALATERQHFADVVDQLRADREKLEAERAAVERDRTALRVEQAKVREQLDRLATERAAVIAKAKESEALKRRAVKRALALRGILEEGERFRAKVKALPAERWSLAMEETHVVSERVAAASRIASQDDAWLAAMLAHRDGQGASR